MALAFLFDPNKQFQSLGGVNEVGGFLRVFLNGTDDRATTYKNFDGTLNEADIELDANGRAVVIVDNTKTYRLEVYNRLGGLMWTVSNYKASGGGGGGSGTPVSVEGTVGEIDVDENTEGGVKHFVVGLAATIKNAITALTMAVNGVANALNGKKDKQTPVNESGSTTKTLVGISQDEDGEITPVFEDIEFPDYSQRFEDIENEQSVDSKVIAAALNDLDARLAAIESEGDNIGDVTADSLDAQNLYVGGVKVKFQQAAMSIDGATDKTVTNISQNENGVITVTYSAIAFPDWTGAITAATDLCEKLANKKTTFGGFETSDTYYPTLKAVVEYLDGRLQNLGGKKITNNGQPFTAASQLPTTTPYYGQNINSSDYAFVQDTGLASRYTATVTGSSVLWTLDYEISLPVFTAEQQAAIDSGVNSTKVGNYDSHISNTSNPHNVTAAQIGAVRYDTASQGLTSTQKQNARTNIGAGTYSVPSGGIPKTDLASGVQSSLDKADSALQNHQSVVNSAPTLSWGNTSTVGSVGGTALTVKMPSNPATGKLDTNGDGSNVTTSFTQAGSRSNIGTGETLATLFGKIKKWFADLGTLAFKSSVTDSDISGTIADAHIASAPTWNAKQNALPTSGTPSSTFAINVSGTSSAIAAEFTSTDSSKEWMELGTFKYNDSNVMFAGLTLAVQFRANDGRDDSGILWISTGEYKTSGDYSNDDIKIHFFAIGRRDQNKTERVSFYAKALGITNTSGAKLYAKVTSFSNVYVTPLNAVKGSWTPSMTYLDSEPLDKKEAVYEILLRTILSTAVGSSSTPVFVDSYGQVQECSGVASRAASGNGNLAVIDGNGNYSSSGISAYNQTMLNGLTSRLGSFVSAINSFSHSFNVIFNGSDISKTLDFENTYASIKFLRFGISYVSGKISYRLPWSGASVDYNGWIIAPDTQTKNGKSIVHTTHTFTVAGNTNTEELYEENELGTTGQSVASIFEKQITTSQTVRGRLSSEIRLYNGVSYKELIVHVDIGYERLSSTGAFYAFGTVTCNTDLFEND